MRDGIEYSPGPGVARRFPESRITVVRLAIAEKRIAPSQKSANRRCREFLRNSCSTVGERIAEQHAVPDPKDHGRRTAAVCRRAAAAHRDQDSGETVQRSTPGAGGRPRARSRSSPPRRPWSCASCERLWNNRTLISSRARI
jgi:hypothetical protein